MVDLGAKEDEEVTVEVVYDKKKVVKVVDEYSMRSFPRAGSVFKIAPQEFLSFFEIVDFSRFLGDSGDCCDRRLALA